MRNLILNLFCIYPALYRPGARFRSLFGRNIRIGSGRRRSCFACRTGCFRSFFRRLRPVRPQWDLCPSPYPLPCRFPPLLCRGGCGHVSNPPEHSRRYPASVTASVTASDSVFSSVSAPASYSVSVPACVPAFVSVSDSVFVLASVSASVPASVPAPASFPAPALPSSASTSTVSPSTSRAIV